ncbi:MAG TPA: hypothetical protein VHJ20_11850 [Polyangia bacterium]|nr:hypothetical protein [Polyangia bacterium]
MHDAYDVAGWANFFVAEAGASAALTGLLFVAVSINLAKILQYPQLPGRAAESLILLAGVLAASTLGLVPGQSRVALGAELTAVASLVWLAPMAIQARSGHVAGAPLNWILTRVATHQLAALPSVGAAVSVLVGAGGGLYWLVPATLLSFAGSIVNAWVLLVEIQR